MIEINTLEEAKAAAFRAAYRGLAWQGWRRALATDGETCVYRKYIGKGPGREVHCCGVGWLMAKPPVGAANYASINTLSISEYRLSPPLQAWYDGLANPAHQERRAFRDFLYELQRAHDTKKGSMRLHMENLAEQHGIALPSEYA